MDYESIVGAVLTWDESKSSPDSILDCLALVGQRTGPSRIAFGEYIRMLLSNNYPLINNSSHKSDLTDSGNLSFIKHLRVLQDSQDPDAALE